MHRVSVEVEPRRIEGHFGRRISHVAKRVKNLLHNISRYSGILNRSHEAVDLRACCEILNDRSQV